MYWLISEGTETLTGGKSRRINYKVGGDGRRHMRSNWEIWRVNGVFRSRELEGCGVI